MKSLHILHSEAATGWGGQEIRVLQESLLLLERGHRVSLICRPGSPLAKKAAEKKSSNFCCYPVNITGTTNLFSILKVFWILKKIRPDVAHTHSSADSWQVSFCCKALDIPVVRSRHVSIPVKNYFPKNLIYSHFPDKIITSGTTIQDLMLGLDGVTAEKVTSIVAGVDTRRFDCNISGEKIRSELKLKPNQPLIGKIAVIRGWKGHDYFLDAIPKVLEKSSNARFVIVGDGPGYKEIKQKVANKNLCHVVTMLGHREDIPEIIAALDILTLASIEGEATSQVIPQAFAMKVPVVATRAGGISEVLRNGELGILVEPKNSESIADGINSLLENPESSQTFIYKAYDFCLRELSIDRMMGQTISVYEDVIRARA